MKRIISVVLAFTLFFLSMLTPRAEEQVSEAESVRQSETKSAPEVHGINVEYHTPEEVIRYIDEYGTWFDKLAEYDEEPDYRNPPYSPGKLKQDYLENALAAVNSVRYISGLTYDIKLDDTYNELAQAAALICMTNFSLDHYPPKPEGMDDELYRKAYEGASHSSLGMGAASLEHAVIDGWIYDSDDSNVSRVGHRTNMLDPAMGKCGFGEAELFCAFYTSDKSNPTDRTAGLWPGLSTPRFFFPESTAWSVRLKDTADASKIRVKLTCLETGRTWELYQGCTDGYFNVHSFAGAHTIIWQPYGIDILTGDIYQVEITGLNSGTVSYPVEFCDWYDAPIVTFEQKEVFVKTGDTVQLNVSLTDYGGEESKWPLDEVLGDDSECFDVSYEGNTITVTGKKTGDDWITAHCNFATSSTYGDRCHIHVVDEYDAPESIELNITEADLEEKETLRLSAILKPLSADPSITWTSDLPECAAVDTGGLITALKAGTAHITAETVNGLKAVCTVNVSPHEHIIETPVYEWAADNSTVTAFTRCTACNEELTETVNTVYEVLKEATLEEEGLGKYTAEFTGSFFETQIKEIVIPILSDHSAKSITLNMHYAAITIREPVQLTAAILPADCEDRTVKWTSSNPETAMVNDRGLVTGIKPGVAIIRAETVNGLSDECTVRIVFTDVADSKRYYFDPVYWCVDQGITVGYGGVDLFSPEYPVTRGQFVTFLYRLAGSPEVTEMSGFSDVDDSVFYAKPIAWAAASGITTGYAGRNEFGPDDRCTREQIVTFLWRYAESPVPSESIHFTDAKANAYYLDALSWAAEKKITLGLNDGTGRFGVGMNCTRGMTVTFLYRFANK
ncbi:MAG: S-layer homology domain-containing protein [Erysipelotrichaceae bacterium]|nr:S-layer homology domain-containing protein [Erysipelotrichaceae bacterium]